MQPVALVTGGAVRVGRAISYGLAERGHRVVVNYNRSAEAAESLVEELSDVGPEAIALHADVSDPGAANRLLEATLEAYGRVDVVVNNAAIFDERPLLEVDDELWQRTLAVNLSGPFHVARAAARAMRSVRSGRIINICGTAGVTPIGDHAPYCASKAGLDMLTRCLAEALAPDIQVNGVAPGTVLFPENTPEEQQERVIARIPLGQIGRPRDIADAVCFLARAPSYMTGTILTVDGGAGLGTG